MQKIEIWQENKNEYLLCNDFMLKRADKNEFAVHHTIYSNADLELRYSWNKQISDAADCDNPFWIFYKDKRIGGVVIQPNRLFSLFVETPCSIDKFTIISELNKALLLWSDDKDIAACGIMPDDIKYYNMLGYKSGTSRRVMIRPTELFKDINFGENVFIKIPTLSDAPEIASLFIESYKGGADYAAFGEPTLSEAVESVQYILTVYKSNNFLDASTLVYDKNTNELIGACIAGISGFCDNDFSEIGELAVKPAYRRHGLAQNMLRRALSVLNTISPASILCVTIGNDAESLYYKMGFFPGTQFSNMLLKH